MPAPRSDYLCSRCEVTHELPIGTTACPTCQKSRWFTRVYSANVSTSGIAARKDPALQSAYDAAMKPKEAAKLSQRQLGAPMLAVPNTQDHVSAALQDIAKRHAQARGLPEARMGGIGIPTPALKKGASSHRDGSIQRRQPLPAELTNEMKMRPPQPDVAFRDKKAGETIAKALRK